MIRPDFDTFADLASQGTMVAVARDFPFDTDTAVTAYAKLARPPFGFLLESVTGGERWARYTFLGTRPRAAWRLRAGGRVSRWEPERGWGPERTVPQPLDDLAAEVRRHSPVLPPGTPRFFGGAVGYLGYDVVRHFERLPHPPPDSLGLPEALLVFTDVVLAIDNVYGRAHAITTVETGGADRAELANRYRRAVERLDAVVHTLATSPGPPPLEIRTQPDGASLRTGFDSSFDRPGFERAVRRIHEHIAAGDAFQVVLSQRLEMPLAAPPFQLYRALRSLNPSPYMYFLELDGLALVGASPEALARVEDGRVVVRPIAGTRPRGDSDADDQRLARQLLADPKERAEHLMLVDLGRNDVGRVAHYGSVDVPELMAVERYSHLLHMVSRVEGRLRNGLDAFDAFRATFPAGTVSGAPKVRAMEIIDQLEPVRRGPYAGTVGYFAYGGRAMDTAIAIRTLLAVGDRAYVQAGAGVVAESDPGREYEETLTKAKALLAVSAMLRS